MSRYIPKVYLSGLVRRALALLVMACLLSAAAGAQPPLEYLGDQDAIGKLRQMPGAVQQVQAMAQHLNFGPYPLSLSCKYKSKKCWRIYKCMKLTWDWQLDLRLLKQELHEHYAAAAEMTLFFPRSFKPLEDWFQESLPAVSRRFAEAAERLRSLEQTATGEASSSAKEAANREIVATLEELLHDIELSLGQLNDGMTKLAEFNRDLNKRLELSYFNDLMETLLANGDRDIEEIVADWPCGGDEARRQYSEVKSQVRRQYEDLLRSARGFGVTSNEADEAVSSIMGTVLGLQTMYQRVLQQLEKAEVTPVGAIQQMKVDIACKAWADLAQKADAGLS